MVKAKPTRMVKNRTVGNQTDQTDRQPYQRIQPLNNSCTPGGCITIRLRLEKIHPFSQRAVSPWPTYLLVSDLAYVLDRPCRFGWHPPDAGIFTGHIVVRPMEKWARRRWLRLFVGARALSEACNAAGAHTRRVHGTQKQPKSALFKRGGLRRGSCLIIT